jgi:transposase InsO family protein
VQQICKEHRIWSTTTKMGKEVAGKTPGPAVSDDLVQRDFSAPAPDMLCLTDITEPATLEGKLCLTSMKDALSNRIVGYSLPSSDRRARARRSASRAGSPQPERDRGLPL